MRAVSYDRRGPVALRWPVPLRKPGPGGGPAAWSASSLLPSPLSAACRGPSMAQGRSRKKCGDREGQPPSPSCFAYIKAENPCFFQNTLNPGPLPGSPGLRGATLPEPVWSSRRLARLRASVSEALGEGSGFVSASLRSAFPCRSARGDSSSTRRGHVAPSPYCPPLPFIARGVLSPGTALTRAARQPRISSCRYLEEVESES